MQHIARTIERKAQAAFPVIVGAHTRDQTADLLFLVSGQLPGSHLRLRASMARSAGRHNQSPELFAALVLFPLALFLIAASETGVVASPPRPRSLLHHPLKWAVCEIQSLSSFSSSPQGGVSSSTSST